MTDNEDQHHHHRNTPRTYRPIPEGEREMKTYEVVYEGVVREVYLVDAESEEEAREKWTDTEPFSSEVIEGAVVEVTEDE